MRKPLDRSIVDTKRKPSIQDFRVDLGAGVNPAPLPEKLILGAGSALLENADVLVTQLVPTKPFPFEPFFIRTKYRYIEGYRGNDTVRGWREYDSIYHAVFADMRSDTGGEQSAASVRPFVPCRPHVAAGGTRKAATAHQAGGCGCRSAKSLNQQLGKTDRERMDQYMSSLNEVESRLIASERWIDIPLKKQDYSDLNLDITNEGDPAGYYRNMFDLTALEFDADITRSITFMLNREDGMGISDTFPF